jgi:hypothetical protein
VGNLTLLRHSDDSVSFVRTSGVSCAAGEVRVDVWHDVDTSYLHSFIALSVALILIN